VTHEYFRHGTTTLFAALDVANGGVIANASRGIVTKEFLSFLRHIEASVPEHLQVHLIVDNYSTHKHAKVRAWLAQRPRYSLHFTPTYSSWINQVERWFGLITQRAIRRDSFPVPSRPVCARSSSSSTHYKRPSATLHVTATATPSSPTRKTSRAINGTSH